jgi:putative FmdB family regulatory protein
MPIYEYVCRKCDHQFEALLATSQASAECPECKGEDLEKLLSVFSVAGEKQARPARLTAGPCGTCGDPRGPGACSMD